MFKRIVCIVATLFFVVSIGLSSYAAQLDDAKKEKQQVDNQLKDLEKEKQKEKQNISSTKEYRNSLKVGLEKKGYEKELIESKIQEILSAIETLDAAIAQSEEDYEAQLKLFQERLVIQYMRSRVGSDLIELADCNDFNDLIRRLHAMELIAKFDQDLMNSLIEKKADIEALRAQREAEEANFEAQLEKNLEELKKLEVSRSQTEERIAQSQKTLAQIEKEEDALEKESKELTALIKKLSTTSAYTGGVMQWPLPGYKVGSRVFGYQMHPILKVRKFHSGVDIGAPQGTYIHAAASGKVVWSGWRSGGSGNVVILDHGGGMTTLYLHIMNGGLLVKEGQTVKAGDVIAKVGSTGLSTGPHLHFEVRKNGEPQDPMKYVTSSK